MYPGEGMDFYSVINKTINWIRERSERRLTLKAALCLCVFVCTHFFTGTASEMTLNVFASIKCMKWTSGEAFQLIQF